MSEKKPIKSKRDDGRGHWPGGKRRNIDTGDWQRTRIRLRKLIDDHWTVGHISYRALADHLHVSDRTVRRWVSGEDRPPAETQEKIAAWIESKQ